MAAAPSPEAARRRIVECARRHGSASAARMSGADRSTVLRLARWADAGRSLARESGSPPMSAREKGRILAVKRAHPEESARLMERNRDIPWSHQTITQVLREAGMLRKVHVPTRDPDFWIRWHSKQRLFAKIELCLGLVARLKGYTGRIADTDTPLRRLRRSERRLEYWRARSGKPDRAGEFEAANSEMDACLARLAELEAAALERVMADIRRK